MVSVGKRALRSAALVGVGLALVVWLWSTHWLTPWLTNGSVNGSANGAASPGPSVSISDAPEPPGVFAISGEALLPLPPAPVLPPEKVALGKALFLDPRLSKDNTVACVSCHNLGEAGNDGRAVSVGVGGALGAVNAPTVFNSSLNFAQFWDGRAGSLEEQAPGPVHNPVEMASRWEEVIAKLSADDGYRRQFKRLYPEGMSATTIVDAIVAFEKALLTPNAPFDRFLRGEQQAISAEAREGFRRFKEFGCASCHQGVNIGGNMFQRFGVMGDYFQDRAIRQAVTAADLGRFNVTGKEDDRHVFKVPSLRNVALTAPYFHDGSVTSLDEAVVIMARYQLGRTLSKEEVHSIVAFLQTLSGERPAVVGP